MLVGTIIAVAGVLAIGLASGGRGLDFNAREVNYKTEWVRSTHR